MINTEKLMRHTSYFPLGRGRPVRHHIPLGMTDLQSLPPAGWCSRCGGEVYRRGTETCRRCRKQEG